MKLLQLKIHPIMKFFILLTVHQIWCEFPTLKLKELNIFNIRRLILETLFLSKSSQLTVSILANFFLTKVSTFSQDILKMSKYENKQLVFCLVLFAWNKYFELIRKK